MFKRLNEKFRRLRKLRRWRNEEGQAITEYGAIIAFIAVLVALMFAFCPSSVGPAISNCFSSITNQLNDMSNTASGSSGS